MATRSVLSGSLEPGDVTFEERRPLTRPRRLRGEFEADYAVRDARGSGVRFVLRDVHVRFTGSSFSDCVFEQKRTWLAAGDFGDISARSRYQRCRFVGVDFGLRGFGLGRARFEDCTFEHCRTDHLFAVGADLIGCRFVGPVTDAQFLGADPATGIPNEIRDNDFSAADVGRISFQAGARPDQQLWPAGTVVDGDASSWERVVSSGGSPLGSHS